MKKKNLTFEAIGKRFRNEKIQPRQMNFLMGGDADGGQGGTNDPWNPNGGG